MWSTSRTGRFSPGKEISYSFYKKLRESKNQSEGVWEILPSKRFDPSIVQPVTSRYTYCAIPAQITTQTHTHTHAHTHIQIHTHIHIYIHTHTRTHTHTHMCVCVCVCEIIKLSCLES